MVCLKSNNNSICATQCDACPGGGNRKKRGLGDYSGKDLAEENLVLGPYMIVENDDATGYRRPKGEGMLVYRLLGTFDVWEH